MCFDPEFVDDGFCGGPISSVWVVFEQELALADKYELHFDLAKTTLYILAGDNFSGDLRPFEALGVRIVKGVDVQMLQVPVAGSHDFFSEWKCRNIVEIDEVIGVVE